MADDTWPDPSTRLPFNDWVKDHARGTLNDELTMALSEVVEAVTQLDKPGSVVLKLAVDTAGSGGRTVVIAGDVVSKPPKPAPEQSIFFVGERGSLHRDDPYTRRLPGTAVPTDDAAARRLPTDTGEARRITEE